MMNEQLNRLDDLGAERQRLLDTLRYYKWLEQFNITYADIKGVAYVTDKGVWRKPLVSLKLKDGSVMAIPVPPFDKDVVLNKTKLKDNQ